MAGTSNMKNQNVKCKTTMQSAKSAVAIRKVNLPIVNFEKFPQFCFLIFAF